jgi:hypothetical protein
MLTRAPAHVRGGRLSEGHRASTAAISARSTGNSAMGAGLWRSPNDPTRCTPPSASTRRFADLEHPRNLNAMSSSALDDPPAGDRNQGRRRLTGWSSGPPLTCPQIAVMIECNDTRSIRVEP